MGIQATAEKAVLDEMATNSQLLHIISDILLKMEQGFYGSWLDVVIQKHSDGYTLADAYYFAVVWQMFWRGEIYACHVSGCGLPSPDKEQQRNDGKLKRLAAPFSGCFIGGYGEGDGSVEWASPVLLTNLKDGTKEIALPPGSAVLEVGTTSAFTTCLHLNQGTTLARWPYSDDEITLIHRKQKRPRG